MSEGCNDSSQGYVVEIKYTALRRSVSLVLPWEVSCAVVVLHYEPACKHPSHIGRPRCHAGRSRGHEPRFAPARWTIGPLTCRAIIAFQSVRPAVGRRMTAQNVG